MKERLHVNYWGPTGNGKSTLFGRVMQAFGEDAAAAQKDSTRDLQLRPREAQFREYRQVPRGLFERRAMAGHYRYPPEVIFDGGKMNLTGIPKQKYLPEFPLSKLLVCSVFPLDLRHKVCFPGRRTINIFVLIKAMDIVEEMEIVEARLRARPGIDPGTLEHKLWVNRAFREGQFDEELKPPHFYYPHIYDHIVNNRGDMEETLAHLAKIIPGLRERLRVRATKR